MIRLPPLEVLRDLTGVLFSKEGLAGKGFELAVWFANYVHGIVQKEASLEDELVKIQRTIDAIRALLKDADQMRIEHESVKKWLRDLYGLSLDADDLLDLVHARKDDAATSQMQEEGRSVAPTLTEGKRKRKSSLADFFASWKRKLSDLRPSSAYSCSFSAPQFVFRLSAATEAGAIQGRLDEITKRKKQLQIPPGVAPSITDPGRPPPTAAAVNEADIVGMASDRQKIVNLLVQGGPHPRLPMVVAVKGMGGSGKTTLVRCICNEDAVRERFRVIWVDVMEDHGVEKITAKMLDSLGEPTRFCNFDTSQRRLMELVSDKLLLLVLDNIEDGFLRSWDTVKAALSAAALGSKVLVTTTSDRVAREVANFTQHLEGLSESEWLQLFMATTGNLDNYHHLQELATQIARRCQCSPFAAKFLGSVLSSCRDVRVWESVVGQGTPSSGVDDIKQMLRRSYDLFPLHVKRCFAFCAIFPHDHVLNRSELVKLWVACGFTRGTIYPEAEGSTYFDQLHWRSFFEQVATPETESSTEEKDRYFRIPSLIHDLARSVSTDECLILPRAHRQPGLEVRYMLLNVSRHGTETDGGADSPDSLINHVDPGEHLRVFKILQGDSKRCLSNLPADLFLKMPCLRDLDLRCTAVCQLPDSIGELKLLQYLNLFGTPVAKLPDSLTSLRNLQSLNLGECYMLHELPQGTSKITSLRHLSLQLRHLRQSRLASMPPGINKLSCLQTLPRFVVGKSSEGCGLDQLENLSISGELCLSKLENVEEPVNAEKAKLQDKKYIGTLILQWTTRQEEQGQATVNNLSSPHGAIVSEALIEKLQPQRYLKTLWIDNCGDPPPQWLPRLEYLASLRLSHCPFWESLSLLEQLPRLQHLRVEGLGKVTGMRIEGGQSARFLCLETFILQGMTNLKDWIIRSNDMPNLKKLCLIMCPQLTEIRFFPPNLVKLRITGCDHVKNLPELIPTTLTPPELSPALARKFGTRFGV